MTPEQLASPEAMEWYADLVEALGGNREMVGLLRKCPICEEPILECDNGWLDGRPGGNGAEFSVMKLGPLYMMGGGGLDGGSRHRLHEHQPGTSRAGEATVAIREKTPDDQPERKRYIVYNPVSGNLWSVFGMVQEADTREEAVFWAERFASKNGCVFVRPEGWQDVIAGLPEER